MLTGLCEIISIGNKKREFKFVAFGFAFFISSFVCCYFYIQMSCFFLKKRYIYLFYFAIKEFMFYVGDNDEEKESGKIHFHIHSTLTHKP